ncbi:MAG: transcriptional regulator [Anaerolineales bacterium]|nr:transcriptional regulator [Anaerolineales bacterium]MCX7754393.1 transcriptional regulator [Anaerolineales bacterium]MDW8277915.1 transcriptional regulator [Anaerolineales bacterium]
MTNDLRSLTEIDRLLHEPARTVIVAILAAVESADFVFLQRETGLTKGNLSTHLTKLEDAGYIEIQKTFRGKYPLTLCRLTEQGRKAFTAYRKQLLEFVERTK